MVRGRSRRHAEAGRPQALGQPRGAVLRGLGRRVGGGDGGRHRHEEAGRLVLRGPVGFVVGADPGPLLGSHHGDAWLIAAVPRKAFTAFRWPTDVPLPSPHKLPMTIARTLACKSRPEGGEPVTRGDP